MSIPAVPPTFFFHTAFFLIAAFTAQSKVAQAQGFEPVCQVSISSGFCKKESPSTDLLVPQDPELSVHKALEFATFERPFSVNSLWNIRPRQVVFGNSVIPESTYYPMVGTGKYSSKSFLARPTDAPVIIYPSVGSPGVWDPDAEVYRASVTIPHWPAETVPASGSDGHADIVDVESGIIYSFWQLRNTDGRWTAAQYAWSRLDGRGWGDGVHYFQGARAAGIPPMAGLIRTHEINDGSAQYNHALSMSLTHNGLSEYEQYVFPATSGDRTWTDNTGRIPTGALMMLPPSFDANTIGHPDLRKVVNTLKTYGAYVVDRNVGTPFYIYVENGSGFNLHRSGWNSVVANDLQRIRAALRQVIYASDWVNSQGEPVTSLAPLNMVSMRGPWRPMVSGETFPVFDSTLQSVVFGVTNKACTAESASDRAISRVNWAKPVKGRLYEFRVEASNGGRAYMRYWGGGVQQFHTRALGNGETYRFRWPSVDGASILGVVSGVGEKTVIRAILTEVPE